jgi:alkylated DNA repair dioxygenase AlkB
MNSTLIKQDEILADVSSHENTLLIVPSKDQAFKKIYLTKNKSAWLTITWLSKELIEYTKKQYPKLLQLRPIERGKVVLYNEEIQSSRWHRSYLKTPTRSDAHQSRSYMYSGKDPYDDTSLPELFQPYLDFSNKGNPKDEYNQVIVNWYLDGNDFIAAHSDCQMNMKPNAGIAIISLCEKEEDFRELQFKPKKNCVAENDFIYRDLKISALNGSIITMYGDTQNKFRHKVPKSLHIKTSRISITLRKF